MGDEKPKAVFTGDLIHADGSVDHGVEGLLLRGKSAEKPSPGPWHVAGSGNIESEADIVCYYPTPADAALIADAPAMLDLLRELEWSWDGACPRCVNFKDDGHGDECRLGALLDKHGRV